MTGRSHLPGCPKNKLVDRRCDPFRAFEQERMRCAFEPKQFNICPIRNSQLSTVRAGFASIAVEFEDGKVCRFQKRGAIPPFISSRIMRTSRAHCSIELRFGGGQLPPNPRYSMITRLNDLSRCSVAAAKARLSENVPEISTTVGP